MFKFDYSYLTLPNSLYSITPPCLTAKIEIKTLNHNLLEELDLSTKHDEILSALLSKEYQNKSYAQAYAGHQFGQFTQLGDGRAIIIGEHLTKNKERFDIQLKGGGKTKYSRRGDGKATLKAMLREYIISEAMHYLQIPTSRGLGVLKTNETVYRNFKEEGSILIRTMRSHIRIGTFEYAYYFGKSNELQALTHYTINRLYPEIKSVDNPPLALLKTVMEKQIELVVNWMRIGFIHGVMNTDNIAISGETFDYGPCAFMNTYDPNTVYSSIDRHGRYAFGNQPTVLKWNISRFAESLLPLIHSDSAKSVKLAQSVINEFDEIWNTQYYAMMLNKIGFESTHNNLNFLIEDLLDIMKNHKMDYTNTFRSLASNKIGEDFINISDFKKWYDLWKENIEQYTCFSDAKQLMRKTNPLVIARNNSIEQALENAENDNYKLFNSLLAILSTPFDYDNELASILKAPSDDFEKNYQTFCGT